MSDGGTAILHAAAQVRELLIGLARDGSNWRRPRSRSRTASDRAADGQSVGYGELVAGDVLHVQAQPQSKRKDPPSIPMVGRSLPRVDIPAKVTGGAAYVQDMRLPGMVHARIVGRRAMALS